MNAPKCWGLNGGMTGWERQHGVEKTDKIWRRQVWWGFGVEGSQRQGWIEQTVRPLVHTGAGSMWILQSGGQVRGWGVENQTGATGINGGGRGLKPLQWLCRGHIGSAGREPGKPRHSWGGRKHDKESRVCEV